MKSWTRPDGRCFVFGDIDDALPDRRLYATADESDRERVDGLVALGFTPIRRELVLRLSTDPRRWASRDFGPPPGIAFRRADQIDETQLRLLDDLLRQDVPGADGWRWDEADFREETYASPDFDPAAYLVAVNAEGDHVGLARVWMRPERPRLGFVGVRSEWREKGVARALLAAVFGVLHDRGLTEVRTEVDENNVPSRTLLASFDGERIGSSLEFVREPTS